MISIQLSNLNLILGARTIIQQLNWEIQDGQRVGLIGPNGAGKSSLLKTIVGEYSPEQGGRVVRARGVTVGYLPQQPELDLDQTAFEAAIDGNPRPGQIEAELERVEHSLGLADVYGNPHRLESVLSLQQTLIEEYATLGGESYSSRVRDLLLGLGLQLDDLEKKLGFLSGGQKKLVGLARLLLFQPSVLLLDEPDNHLDLPGKRFLEELILGYAGAVVIVSHDRYLLDTVVTHIAEIEDTKLTTFIGDYSSYMLEKERRLARQEQLFQVQQHDISRLQASIKRLALWGKIYDNPKFTSRAKAMQNRLDKMEKIDQPIAERRMIDLRLDGWRGSKKVLELRGLCKEFKPRVLLQDIDLVIHHGERVGLIGPNGSGKSVLMRMILQQDYSDAGEIVLGPSVKTAHYAQEHETLDFDQTLLDTVRYAGSLSESAAVSHLIRFLFTYQQATQKIHELSGGERSRLQLALLVLSGANFLLLDEPTNNLDIASAEVLENALNDFNGSVLVISHDRYFLDRVVDRLLVIEDSRLVSYLGGYSDYLAAAYGNPVRRLKTS